MKNIIIIVTLFIFSGVYAQKNSEKVTTKMNKATNFNKIKIDGVAVVVGDNIVLASDVEKLKIELKQRLEGKELTKSDCEIMEEIMLQKLLAHHAVVDSVEVSEAEINQEVERNVGYFMQQLGSMDKVVELYGFDDEEDLRKELAVIQKEQLLIRKESASITKSIDVTPEEVRTYYKTLEANNSLPEFSTEIELAQIVKVLKPSKEEVDRVINKLKEIKKEVEEKIKKGVEGGFTFKLKAMMNSEDPGVSTNGGKYTITRQSGFIKEFKEVAFSLDEGQISEPFKSGFGYHILFVEKIKGQERDVSHVLIKPKLKPSELKAASDELTKVRDQILKGEITFEDAVLKYSEDKETRMNKGLFLNSDTNDSKFDLTRMDPVLYNRVSNLKKGEITAPFFEEPRGEDKVVKLFLLKNRIEAHKADFSKDYEKIQQLALMKKKEETVEKWAQEKIADTYIKINGKYKKCNFTKNWKKVK